MDFMVGLTPSTHGYDVTFVCVDKLSQIAHSVPTMTNIFAERTERLSCDHVYKLHGIPKVILSDMEVRFTSRFWNALHGVLGTRLAISIALHPPTNERHNR
jgi:hypothetical protein